MTYHKIRNVPLEVCAAEQKIAYNCAFYAHISFQDEWDEAKRNSAVCASDLLHEIIQIKMKDLRRELERKNYLTRYDLDAIQACLNAGLADYLDKPFIATLYEQVGKAFPAHYLKGANNAL